jgi:geranylgeranyl pyrophosphate synthase
VDKHWIATNQHFSAAYVETMHRKKTGALIQASVELAAVASACTAHEYDCLQVFSGYLGLAFQIQDDILDIASATQLLGKQQGADFAAGKLTYPQATSVSQAKARVAQLYEQALNTLAKLNSAHCLLIELARYLIGRTH